MEIGEVKLLLNGLPYSKVVSKNVVDLRFFWLVLLRVILDASIQTLISVKNKQ
jgi:hypothetical protein